MKVTRDGLFEMFNGIESILGSEKEYKFAFNYALIKTKKGIKSEVEEVVDMVNAIAKEQKALNVQYATKDDDGKPVIANNKYVGLNEGECPEYDEKSKELVEKRKAYLSEEVEVKEYKIPKSAVPATLKGKFQETITDLIEE